MRVGIDYTSAATQGAGIGRYTRELMRALLALPSNNYYSFFYASPKVIEPSAFTSRQSAIRFRPSAGSYRLTADNWRLQADRYSGAVSRMV